MRRSTIIVMILFFNAVLFAAQARAGSSSSPETYSGDLYTRSTFLGSFGGARDTLSQKGVIVDSSLTQIAQGIPSGGKDNDWRYGGRANLTITANTQKLGWWPGGTFMMEIEGNFADDINAKTGSLMAVNSNQMYPLAGSNNLNIPAFNYVHSFSEQIGLIVGKIDTTSMDANEFANGKGDNQFFNMAFNVNPVTLITIPYSGLGGGVILHPVRDPEEAVITVTYIDADGKSGTTGSDTVFGGDETYSAEGRMRTNIFGLTGHQLLGCTYSSKGYTSFSQNIRFLFPEYGFEKESDSWCLYYNFDQYLYEPAKGKGIGLFGRLGTSDGDANPVHHFFSLGVGGKGVVPLRRLDSFGVGFYYINIHNPRIISPFITQSFLRNEYGLEAYYNFGITPWLQVTPDIQIVRGAQDKSYNISTNASNSLNTELIDTAFAFGLRLKIIF